MRSCLLSLICAAVCCKATSTKFAAFCRWSCTCAAAAGVLLNVIISNCLVSGLQLCLKHFMSFLSALHNEGTTTLQRHIACWCRDVHGCCCRAFGCNYANGSMQLAAFSGQQEAASKDERFGEMPGTHQRHVILDFQELTIQVTSKLFCSTCRGCRIDLMWRVMSFWQV